MDIMPPDNQLPPHHAPTGLKLWLAIFGVVLVVALGYLVWVSNTAPDTTDNSTVTVKPATTSTADWKTYTNAEQNYSFKYPADWVLETNEFNTFGPSITSPETISHPYCLSAEPCKGYEPDIDFHYYSSISEEDSNKSNDLGAKNTDDLIAKDGTKTRLGSTTIGGITATEVTQGGNGAYYSIFIEKNGHIYNIFFRKIESPDKLTATQKAILASFKFTS